MNRHDQPFQPSECDDEAAGRRGLAVGPGLRLAFGLRTPTHLHSPRRTRPAAVDKWLRFLTTPDHLDATMAAILTVDEKPDAEPGYVTQARHRDTVSQWSWTECSPPPVTFSRFDSSPR